MCYFIAKKVYWRNEFLWLEPNNNIKKLYPPQRRPQKGANGNTNTVIHRDKSRRRMKKATILSGFCQVQTPSIQVKCYSSLGGEGHPQSRAPKFITV